MRRLRDQQAGLDVTYPEIGATRDADLPPRYNHDHRVVVVGYGDEDWARAKEALRRWRAHANAGVTVFPADAPLAEGVTVALGLPVGPMVSAVAACRIVYVVDDDTRFGFGYGTLPAHPEQGEESFIVQRVDESIEFVVRAFSRPVQLLVRATAPIGRRMQNGVTAKYLDGVRAFVAERQPS